MKRYTTFRIGGPARFLLLPDSPEELCNCIKICRENKIPFFIIGNGSNLLVSDAGLDGAVIKTSGCRDFRFDGSKVYAQSGILLSKLANEALKRSLSGLEFAAGIPGSLGGAVCMNAGAYGECMQNVVREVEFISESGRISVSTEHGFSYRNSVYQKEPKIVISAVIELLPGNYEQIKSEMTQLASKRREKQPLNFPSAGSVFRRPEGFFAGKLIEDCGLKGYTIGGACVSEKHAGFIVNRDNASFSDVRKLIQHIKDSVYEKFGVALETEIKILE